jgi:hypothetical protein
VVEKTVNKTLLVIGFLLAASGARAEPVVYECNYDGNGAKGWISKRAYYFIDEAKARARVYDGAVAIANDKKAIEIPLEIRKGKVYNLKYNLNLPARGNYEIKVRYRVRLDAVKLRASIKVWAGESDVADLGGASCKITKLK